MAACSDSPLPRILLARHESRSHASREPACQPAGPGAAPLSPRGTLWRWLRGGILRASEHFKQKGERHSTRKRREVEGKKAKLSGQSHSKTRGALEPEQQQQRGRLTPTPAGTGTDRKQEHFCPRGSRRCTAALGIRTNEAVKLTSRDSLCLTV